LSTKTPIEAAMPPSQMGSTHKSPGADDRFSIPGFDPRSGDDRSRHKLYNIFNYLQK
jgi:hypothetical protein